MNLFADSIVLECEQSVQHLYAEPPVVVEAGLWRAVWVSWEEPGFFADLLQEKLAIPVFASQTHRDILARAVDLRGIPPSGV